MKRAVIALAGLVLGVVTSACGDSGISSPTAATAVPVNPPSSEKLQPLDDTIVWAG